MQCFFALPHEARASRRLYLAEGARTSVDALSRQICAEATGCSTTNVDAWDGAIRLAIAGRTLRPGRTLEECGVAGAECRVECLARLMGGIDFQNRAGSKPGAGGVASSEQQNVDRRERLRKLALETVDLNKDPYFMRNHLGTFECKLCLTLHNNEGNYLAHTQGKKHQQNLARRAFKEQASMPVAPGGARQEVYTEKRHTIKIGRPGYKVTKSRDVATNQRSLFFEIDYPEAEEGVQPRHRFMGAYEQRVEAPDKNYQYILFACDPYETVGFKIPAHDVDNHRDRFFSNWDPVGKKFTLTLTFLDDDGNRKKALAQATAPKRHRADLTYEGRT